MAEPPSASFKASETAILLIDIQNDFCKKSGVLYDFAKEVLEQIDMLGNLTEVLDELRGKGVTVIHCPLDSFELYSPVSGDDDDMQGLLRRIREQKALRSGSWGVKVVSDVAPDEADHMVCGKRGLDAFHNTNLEALLSQFGITTIAVCGLTANGSVASTAASAYNKHYKVVALQDCIGAESIEDYKAAMKATLKATCRFLTADQFLKACV